MTAGGGSGLVEPDDLIRHRQLHLATCVLVVLAAHLERGLWTSPQCTTAQISSYCNPRENADSSLGRTAFFLITYRGYRLIPESSVLCYLNSSIAPPAGVRQVGE
jgi:hypothetical protein